VIKYNPYGSAIETTSETNSSLGILSSDNPYR
jgi:hypothetical protein